MTQTAVLSDQSSSVQWFAGTKGYFRGGSAVSFYYRCYLNVQGLQNVFTLQCLKQQSYNLSKICLAGQDVDVVVLPWVVDEDDVCSYCHRNTDTRY